MFNTGFSSPTGQFANTAAASGVQFLQTIATSRKAWVAGSLPGASASGGFDRPHNLLHLYGPQGEHSMYAKRHLFCMGNEAKSYSAGEQHLTLPISGMRVSFFICYDLRFPVSISRVGAESDLLVFLANWPSARQSHWRALLIARAIENQCYVAGVNRVGSGGGLTYSGGSIIIDPRGEILAEADDSECTISAVLDPVIVTDYRSEFPALQDRAKLD